MNVYGKAARRFAASIRSAAIRALIFYSIGTQSASAVTLSRIVEANGIAVLSAALQPAGRRHSASLTPVAATTAPPARPSWPCPKPALRR